MIKRKNRYFGAACFLVAACQIAEYLLYALPKDQDIPFPDFLWRLFMGKLEQGNPYSVGEVLAGMWIILLALFLFTDWMWIPYDDRAVYFFVREHRRTRVFAKKAGQLGGYICILVCVFQGIPLLAAGIHERSNISWIVLAETGYMICYLTAVLGLFVMTANWITLYQGPVNGLAGATAIMVLAVILQKGGWSLLNALNPLCISFETAECRKAICKLMAIWIFLLGQSSLVIRFYARYDILHQDQFS